MWPWAECTPAGLKMAIWEKVTQLLRELDEHTKMRRVSEPVTLPPLKTTLQKRTFIYSLSQLSREQRALGTARNKLCSEIIEFSVSFFPFKWTMSFCQRHCCIPMRSWRCSESKGENSFHGFFAAGTPGLVLGQCMKQG